MSQSAWHQKALHTLPAMSQRDEPRHHMPRQPKAEDRRGESQEQNHQGFGGADDPGVFLEEGLAAAPTVVEGACLEGGGSG
ncbi:hypothetical protein Tco_0255243 [Tanacetum coccineum]